MAADSFAPVRSGVNGIIEPVGSFLAGSVNYGAVRQQNQKLQQQIRQLQQQGSKSQQTEQSLEQLSALLHLPYISNLQTVPAEVTDYESSNFAATIDIGVGRDDGVQLNMPVVSGGGPLGEQLVGQVVQANHHNSTVRLITDGASSVGALYGNPGAFADVVERIGQATLRRPGSRQHSGSGGSSVRDQRAERRNLPAEHPGRPGHQYQDGCLGVGGVGDPSTAGGSDQPPLRLGGPVGPVEVVRVVGALPVPAVVVARVVVGARVVPSAGRSRNR